MSPTDSVCPFIVASVKSESVSMQIADICEVHCELYAVNCALYTESCALCMVRYTLCTVRCALCTVRLFIVHCEVCTVNCRVCSMHCEVPPSQTKGAVLGPWEGQGQAVQSSLKSL